MNKNKILSIVIFLAVAIFPFRESIIKNGSNSNSYTLIMFLITVIGIFLSMALWDKKIEQE